MRYNDMWRRVAVVYGENEAKAVCRLLLEDMFGFSFADIVCGATESLPAEDEARLESAVSRLECAEPVQYVSGHAGFMGRTFHVEPGVLIPRPETEQLCLLAGKMLKEVTAPSLLDIGTGSGCIAVTLALDIPGAKVKAWDVSADALRIAKGNASRLAADVEFVLQNALTPPDDCCLWDAVVSNPPYICRSESVAMERNVLDNEPHLALFVPDDDPLLFYRAIAGYAAVALKPGGCLLFEINPLYARQTERMLEDMGFVDILTVKDEFGKERNTVCRKG